ncbi:MULTISPECIES: hypothetical protein [unclassified Micromonospora]|uniref:hypothetical protein n=1 Tax=unclassified Micromonospora TaxID=2617518 RepID=UPI00332DFD70
MLKYWICAIEEAVNTLNGTPGSVHPGVHLRRRYRAGPDLCSRPVMSDRARTAA